MNNKHTMVLLVIAAVLVAAAYFYSSREQAAFEASAPTERVVATGVTSNTVERIDIVQPGGKAVNLTKRDGAWYTNTEKNHRADKGLLNGLFGVLEKEIRGPVVSTNPDNFGEYEVTETSGTRVKLLGASGGEILDLMVGKAGPSFSSTFVLKPGTEEVVDADASLSYLVNRPEGWRDMAVFDLRGEAIVGVRAEGTTATWTLEKQGDAWRMLDPYQRQGDSDKIQSLLSGIATMRALEYIDTEGTASLELYGLDKPAQVAEISYTVSEGSTPTTVTRRLLLGLPKAEGTGHYARRDDRDEIFVMPAFNAKQLMSAPEELSVEPPAPRPGPVADDAATTPTAPASDDTATTPTEAAVGEAAEPAKDDAATSPTAEEPGAAPAEPAASDEQTTAAAD